MHLPQAIILGIIEGLTEFLPISSTGHLILVSNILGINEGKFLTSFEIIIQLGAILSVPFLYRKKLTKNILTWKKIIVSFIPSAIIGLVFYNIIKHVLLSSQPVTLVSLFAGGIILLFIDKIKLTKKNNISSIDELTNKKAFYIGLFQAVSIIPGTSRSAASIIGGLLSGCSRKFSVEYSFLLALPTMLAASLLDLVKSGWTFSSNEYSLLFIGFITSFITALIAIKSFLKYIHSHSFAVFGIYRIFASVLYFFIIYK